MPRGCPCILPGFAMTLVCRPAVFIRAGGNRHAGKVFLVKCGSPRETRASMTNRGQGQAQPCVCDAHVYWWDLHDCDAKYAPSPYKPRLLRRCSNPDSAIFQALISDVPWNKSASFTLLSKGPSSSYKDNSSHKHPRAGFTPFLDCYHNPFRRFFSGSGIDPIKQDFQCGIFALYWLSSLADMAMKDELDAHHVPTL